MISGRVKVKRPNEPGKVERLVKWDAAIGIATKMLKSRIGSVPQSPYAALDLMKAAKSGTRAEGFQREDEVLADLIAGDQLQASVYAFNLVQKRTKRPAGAPDKELAKKVTKVGVLGAGYMASQLALLFVRRLRVPVVITDIDQERVDKGVAYIAGEIDALLAKGRISPDEANRLKALVTGTTDKADFADCDWVIEAVFEELEIKQDVFAEIEQFISPEAVLATNTSSLSVEQIGAKLAHPERLVGFHFFTPVAVMPLIEVVKTPHTDDATLSTAMVTAKNLKKNAVITADTPGFVVNRLLAVLLGEAMRAVDEGTSFETVDQAIAPLGLPMAPSALLDLVGLKVGAHVLDTHHAAFPDRFYRSENLHKLADYGKLLDKDDKGKVKGFDKGALKIVVGRQEPPQRRRHPRQPAGRPRPRGAAHARRPGRRRARGHRPLHDPRRGLPVPDGRRDALPRPGRRVRARLRRHVPPPARSRASARSARRSTERGPRRGPLRASGQRDAADIR